MRRMNSAVLWVACGLWIVGGVGWASARASGADQSVDPSNTAYLEFMNVDAGHFYRLTRFDRFLICETPECTKMRGEFDLFTRYKHSKLGKIPAGYTVVRGTAITMKGGSRLVEESCSFSAKFNADPLHTYQIAIVKDEGIKTCDVSVTDKSSGQLVTTEVSPWIDDRLGKSY